MSTQSQQVKNRGTKLRASIQGTYDSITQKPTPKLILDESDRPNWRHMPPNEFERRKAAHETATQKPVRRLNFT